MGEAIHGTMRAELTCHRFRLTLLNPFTTSFGTQTERTGYIFRLSAGGVTAYSECVTSEEPFYSYEDNYTALHIITDYLSSMITDFPDPAAFLERCSMIKGHNMAKAAIEMLLWDFHCRREGVSLSSRLGRGRGYANVGVSIGMEDIPAMISKVSSAVDAGYRRIKVKIKRGMEQSIVAAVRDSFPEVPLSVDANTDYRLKDSETLGKLDRYNLEYIEQPLGHDDLLDHAKLAAQLSTPICLDESITDSSRAEQAFDIGACTVINIKPGRVAGLTESVLIARICRERGGHCWVGGMLETGIGRAFNISLAGMEDVDYPGDTSPNGRYFARDVVTNPFTMDSGRIVPNAGPGTGTVVDEDFLSSVTGQKLTIRDWDA